MCAPTPWRPTPFIKASAVLHAGAGLASILNPALWPWAAAAVTANQVLLTSAGLWPRSSVLGPNWSHLPTAAADRREVAITFDDGPDPEVTPAVLELLHRYDAKASFFCIGEKALRYPDLCRQIAALGHSVENHSQRHRHNFALLGCKGFRRELAASQEILTGITGVQPRFFRAPAGLRNPLLDPVLNQLSLRLASWTRRGFDTRDGSPHRVSSKLLRGLRAGDILLLHDGNGARTAHGHPVVLEVLPHVLEEVARAGLRPVTLPGALA